MPNAIWITFVRITMTIYWTLVEQKMESHDISCHNNMFTKLINCTDLHISSKYDIIVIDPLNGPSI